MEILVLTNGGAERTAIIEKQLEGHSFSYIHSENQSQLAEFNAKYLKSQLLFSKRPLSTGEMGAWRIHVRAWEAVASKDSPCVIVEDNVLLHKIWADKKQQILEDTSNFGVVSFAEHPRRCSIATNEPYIIKSHHFPLYMYGLTPYMADILLQSVQSKGYIHPVDSWLVHPKLSKIHTFGSGYKLASRRPRIQLSSYAQKQVPKKSRNLFYVLASKINQLTYMHRNKCKC